MLSDAATTLFLGCGTMVGHQQQELELPAAVVSYFDLPAGGGSPKYLRMRMSNALLASFRAIYSEDNGMWRIEFSIDVPEIRAGIFPIVDGQRQRRSEYAAVFTQVAEESGAKYEVRFVEIDSDAYQEEVGTATSRGATDRTRAGTEGRAYGWY